ncbi:MAG: hypothetical protein ACOCRK_02260 [bacterium]
MRFVRKERVLKIVSDIRFDTSKEIIEILKEIKQRSIPFIVSYSTDSNQIITYQDCRIIKINEDEENVNIYIKSKSLAVLIDIDKIDFISLIDNDAISMEKEKSGLDDDFNLILRKNEDGFQK